MNKHALWVAVLFCIGCAGASNSEASPDTPEHLVAASASALSDSCVLDQRQCRDTELFICNWEGKWVDQGFVIGECGVTCQDNLGGCGSADGSGDICWGSGCVRYAPAGGAIPTYHCERGIPKVEDYCVSVMCEHENSEASCEAEDYGAFCKYSSRSCTASP
jgi:hypothetical protein